MFKQVKNAVRSAAGRALLLAAFASVAVSNARASYDIVSQDGSGNITFTPSGIVTPILTGIIATVAASAALVLAWTGVKWLYRVVKGHK